MTLSTAAVRTENAQSYMRKLGQHWSHRFPVEFQENSGCKIEMPNALCELLAHPDHLDVRLSTTTGEDQDRLQQVVAEHLQRFAFRENLEFVWTRANS